MKNPVQRFFRSYSANVARRLLVLGIACFVLPSSVMADRSVTLVVAPEATSIQASLADLNLAEDIQIESISLPSHGGITETTTSLTYQPSQDFWSIGTDSVTVRTATEVKGRLQ